MAQALFTILDGTIQQLSATEQPFKRIQLFGFSGFAAGAGLNNSAAVLLGIESGKLPVSIPTGSSVSLDFSQENGEDGDNIGNLWVKGTSGNGVYAIYS